ncbi:PIR Superfamily Protein [Plasmodium ovale curtisi]|uniref:PIR Superfamily Protein n=1 Tax=Plasmodium ovale curtisi TaxID=864141 RepID=A0A1A8WPG2_PLAOA|nr:PIR Superfamily Protein [Plasmodium ovale curtisi]SBS99823.1 PIR Superfamily Protein [Plasmodium ovale curtisi]
MAQDIVNVIRTSLATDDNKFEHENGLNRLYSSLDSSCISCYSETCNGYDIDNPNLRDRIFCDHIIHWLYGKVKDGNFDVTELYKFYKKLEILLKNKCLSENEGKKSYKIFVKTHDMQILKYKKELYDFLEYYNNIKNVLNKVKILNKDMYKTYIENMFDLYIKMEINNYKEMYDKEIEHFKEKFKDVKSELTFLEKECPGDYIKLVFNKENNSLRNLKKDKFQESLKNTVVVYENTEMPLTDKSSDGVHAYEDILKEFPSSTIYERLNNKDDINEYRLVCNDVFMLEKDFPWSVYLCEKLSRNIGNNISHIKDNETNEHDRCLYFTFWTYDEIRKIYNGNIQKIFETPLFVELVKVANNIYYDLSRREIIANSVLIQNEFRKKDELIRNSLSKDLEKRQKVTNVNEVMKERFVGKHELFKYKPCFYSFDCSFDKCTEMKDLFDYFKNYNSMETKITTIKNKYSVFCKHLLYINGLYEKYMSKCCTCFLRSKECRDDCPDFFKCNQLYNPYNFYTKIKCNGVLPSVIPMKKVNIPTYIDNYVIIKSENLPLLALYFIRKPKKQKKKKYNYHEEYNEQLLYPDSASVNMNPQNRKIQIAYYQT